MENLTLTQEFLLCEMNKSGKLNCFTPTPNCALIVSILYELEQNNCISLGKEIQLKSAPCGELRYLVDVYEFIGMQKNQKLNSIIEKICLSLNDKFIKQVLNHCKDSLIDRGCILETTNKNIIKFSKTNNVAKIEYQEYIIQKIRSEVLGEGNISVNTGALILLLNKTGKLKEYFSRHEKNLLKTCVKELKTNNQYGFIFTTIEELESSYVAVFGPK